jgi:acyl carrier protein
MLTLEDFALRLQRGLGIELAAPPTPYDGLFDVWGLDSLQAFQMIIVVEDMAGCLVPPPEIPTMLVVGDAYEYYRSLVGSDDTFRR